MYASIETTVLFAANTIFLLSKKKNINIHIKIRAYIVLLLVKSKIKDTLLIHQIILVCRATVEAAE